MQLSLVMDVDIVRKDKLHQCFCIKNDFIKLKCLDILFVHVVMTELAVQRVE